MEGLMAIEDGTVLVDTAGPDGPPTLPGMLLPIAPYTPPGEEKSWSCMGWFSPWGVSGVPGGGKGSSDWMWSWGLEVAW